MAIFYLLIGILYVIVLLQLLFLWNKEKALKPKVNPDRKVSILIPFRNELENIPIILRSILSLSYRPIEVLFIDDHSQDGGGRFLKDFLKKNNPRIPIKVIPNRGIGKKDAIETGIGEAGGEIIFTTDADCILPENWIEEKLWCFEDPEIQMVAGPVMTEDKKGFFYSFQQIEWASILLVTKAGFELGSPIMCSAANMAYRKSAFLEVKGYQGNEHVLSGDDEFLLKKITKKFGAKAAVYLNDHKGLVFTRPQDTWKGLLVQRSRWAAKWKMHGNLSHLFSAVIPVLIQSLFLSSWILLFQEDFSKLVFIFLWFAKIGSERIVLGKVLADLRIHHGLINFILTSVIHPVFVIGTVVATFFGGGKWKGRYPKLPS
ncbi:glycosyltransferase [Aquiflexum sp.]|uniref:glycosyltransferase n=1 Tax=Aquiflexum sp. TaxID=1872584 RepID=UPI0035948CA9